MSDNPFNYHSKEPVTAGVFRNRSRNNPVAMYLMAAYSYYKEDDPIMSDWHFDQLALQLLEEYDKWELHPHRPSRDDLRAGTYLGEYPQVVKGALNAYRRTFHS